MPATTPPAHPPTRPEACGAVPAGDLGAIDARYDVAASTAAGALDFIVVDDTPTAQRCVELLRRRGLGVATFLLLDKQAHLARRAAEKARPPEGAAALPGAAWPLEAHRPPG
jgi:chromosome segregation ATPase